MAINLSGKLPMVTMTTERNFFSFWYNFQSFRTP